MYVLSKNIETKTSISYNKSDHNIISTKPNIKWSVKRVKVMEVFKYNDPEFLKIFKHETTKTDQLSELIGMDKPIDIVIRKFLRPIYGFINLSKKLK